MNITIVFLALGLLWSPAVTAAQGDDPAPEVGADALRGALEEARRLTADNRLDEALPLYIRVAEARPDAGWLRFEVGQALMGGGRFTEAMPWLDLAVKADSLNLEAAHSAALCRDALGLHGGAVRLYKRVLLLDPDHARARFNLGRLQYETGAFEEAESTYRDLLGRHPRHWMALNNLGLVLIDRGQPAAAMGPLRRALSLKAEDPGVLHNLGRASAARRNPARALAYFDRALVAWGAQDLAAVRLHFDRGNALFALGRYKDAIAAYHSALALDPAYSPAHLNLGSALANLGRYAEAVEALEKAVEYDAERVTIYQEIALHYMAKDDPDAALVHLQRAHALDGVNARTFLLLSRALRSSGDLDGARAAQDRACRLGALEACP